jgi:hypothetical protein
MQEKNYDFKQKWFEYLGYKPHDGQIPLHFPKKDNARFQLLM